MQFRLAHKAMLAAILVGSCISVALCIAQTSSDTYPIPKQPTPKPQSSENNSPSSYSPQSQADNYPASKDAGTQPKVSDNHGAGVYTPQSQEDLNHTRKDYADHIRETYNFHFGEGNISTPGNAEVAGDDFVQPGAFPTAKYCSKCHQEAYSQWRQALHSNSFRTPFYRTSVNILAPNFCTTTLLK